MNRLRSPDYTIGFIRHINEDTQSEAALSRHLSSDLDVVANVEQNAEEYESELEEEIQPSVPPKQTDPANTYRRFCSELGIVPCNSFLRKFHEEEIDISHYNVGPLGAKAIAKVMKANTTATLLNMHGNGIRATGAKAIAEMLQDNCFITVLDVSLNFIEKEGIKALCSVLEDNKYIVELSLESTKLNSSAAAYVADALDKNCTLRMLNLSNNEIGEEGSVRLANAIRSNQGIFYLDLSSNHIRNQGAIAVANALTVNNTIKSIDLSRNGFADNGAKTIGNALKTNSTLRELYLAENRIGESGAWGLSIGLEENSGLKVLDVGRNPILSRGAISLIEALITNEESTLEQLYLDDVAVSRKFEEILDQLFQRKINIYVQFGTVIKGQEHRRRGKKQKDLVSRILDAIELRGMRVVDFFRAMDKNGRLAVSKQELITGLKAAGIPLRKSQVDDLFDLLDVDGNGFAQYSEFAKVVKQRTHEEFAKSRNNYQWNH